MDILAPLPDFVDSSAAFSDADLRLQTRNISHAMDALHEVKMLTLKGNPWVEMWRGHEVTLCEYGITLAEEFLSREIPKPGLDKMIEQLKHIEWHMECASAGDFSMDKPDWWGDLRVHNSHKEILLARNPDWYTQHFGELEDTHPEPFFP